MNGYARPLSLVPELKCRHNCTKWQDIMSVLPEKPEKELNGKIIS